MIMAWGMRRLIDHFGLPGSGFLIGRNGLDHPRLMKLLADKVPVCLIGASFGFVHLLDGLQEADKSLSCAPGSRTMDAGGFKGRSKVVSRDALTLAITERLGIPATHTINLLGMTELASQFYDGVLASGRPDPRRKVNAPWTRTRVVGPGGCSPSPTLMSWYFNPLSVWVHSEVIALPGTHRISSRERIWPSAPTTAVRHLSAV